MANWRKTKTTGVYVAHQRRCPASSTDEGRCRCEPSWRGRRRNPATGKPEWQQPITKDRSEVLSWLSAGKKGADHVREKARAERSFESIGDEWLAGVKAGRIGRRRGRGKPYSATTVADYQRAYRNFLCPEFGPMVADEIGEIEWQMWVDRLSREGLSRSRIASHVAVASAIYAWAIAPSRRHATRNPLRLVELPPSDEKPRLRVAFAPEAERLFAALAPEDAVPYAIAFYAGLRRSEIHRLSGARGTCSADRFVRPNDDRRTFVRFPLAGERIASRAPPSTWATAGGADKFSASGGVVVRVSNVVAGRRAAARVMGVCGAVAAVTATATISGAAPVDPPELSPGVERGTRLAVPARDRDEPVELTAERDARSRTYLTADGRRIVKIFAEPVNVRAGDGGWRPIDNRLRPTGRGVENGVGAYDVVLPNTLDEPVRVSEGGKSLSFELVGAGGGDAAVAGNEATYADALPHVDAAYQAKGSAVKEILRLRNRAAPSSFRYHLVPGDDLAARKTSDGAVEFVDGAGRVAFAFAPPFVQDASGTSRGYSKNAVSTALAPDGDGAYELTVSIDRDWLQSSKREFPVELDPTLDFDGADRDCYLVDGTSANTNFCKYSNLNVGFDGSKRSRALLYFDVAPYLPRQAQILHAELGLYLDSKTSSTASSASVHRLTRPWSGSIYGATWNKSDGTIAWTTPGGDFDPAAAATRVTGTSLGWVRWHPTELVREWVEGSVPNHGLLLKAADETITNRLAFDSTYTKYDTPPYLAVTYEPGVGQQTSYDFGPTEPPNPGADDDDTPAGMAARLDVNVANGNLLLREQDVDLAARGPDVEIKRFYNNLDLYTTSTGGGWALGTGAEVELSKLDDGSMIFYGPSAYAVTFQRNADGTFTPPESVESSLARNADGTFTLKLVEFDETYTFDSKGWLKTRSDATGLKLSFAYNGYGDLSSITDADGRRTLVYQDARGYLSKVVEPSGARHLYSHDGSGNLLSYTDPAGRRSEYAYDWDLNLVRVKDRTGRQYRIAYDYENRVTALTAVTDPITGAGATTRYSYETPTAPCDAPSGDLSKTVVTHPDGTRNTYCYETGLVQSSSDEPSDAGAEPKDVDLDDSALSAEDLGDGESYECLPEPGEAFCGSSDSTEPDSEPALDPDAPNDGAAAAFGAAAIPNENNWGLADDNPQVDNPFRPGNAQFDIFANRSFKALSVKRVRKIVPWDVALHDDWSRQGTDLWIQKALAGGMRPLVSFQLCLGERNGIPCERYLPSVQEYGAAVAAFLARYPAVKDYTAWNEPNHSRQPTSFIRQPGQPSSVLSGAERAGQFWLELRRQCAARTDKCNVAAGDFLDTKTDGPTGRAFFRQYRAGMGHRRPAAWAWHAYSDGQATARLDPDATPRFERLRRFLKATRSTRAGVSSPPVWLTEQGAIKVTRDDQGRITRFNSEKRQAKIARFLVRAPSISGRIKRFYYYHLRGDQRWDSGLLRKSNSSRRPVFYVYKRKTNP
jgi:YD repeat-containing protein